jgi:flagellar basal-body rod protein FlgC
MKVSDFFSTFNISSAGLNAEKRRLALTAENIANANTTRTEKGIPYKRKVLLQKVLAERRHFFNDLKNAQMRLKTSSGNHMRTSSYSPADIAADGFSDIRTSVQELNDFKEVYDPEHPDANAQGVVSYPDVNVVTEMLELISASRSFEANITMMNATKSMAKKSMEI